MYTYQELREIVQINRNNKERISEALKFFKIYPLFSVFISFLLIIAVITIFVYTIISYELFDLSDKHNLGDAFGGLTNPIIAFIGVFVTFLAFYIQFKFNKEQSKLISQQKIEYKKDKFDKKFYELLKMHSENVKEFNIDNRIYGRKTFVHMLNELKVIHKVVNYYFGIADNILITNNFNREDFSYMIFFNGLDVENKYTYLEQNLNEFEIDLLNDVFYKLFEIQYNYLRSKSDVYNYEDKDIGFLEFAYYPFDGHSHRLGHYYRHLHNFLEIIDKEKIISNVEKKQYVDLIRAQLSDYEQALLYCNAVSWFLEQWERYFEEYTVIKNLRRDFVSFTMSPEDIFREHIERMIMKKTRMFEWVKLDT